MRPKRAEGACSTLEALIFKTRELSEELEGGPPVIPRLRLPGPNQVRHLSVLWRSSNPEDLRTSQTDGILRECPLLSSNNLGQANNECTVIRLSPSSTSSDCCGAQLLLLRRSKILRVEKKRNSGKHCRDPVAILCIHRQKVNHIPEPLAQIGNREELFLDSRWIGFGNN